MWKALQLRFWKFLLQGFSVPSLLTFWARQFYVAGGYFVHCRILSSISSLNPQDASNNIPPLVFCLLERKWGEHKSLSAETLKCDGLWTMAHNPFSPFSSQSPETQVLVDKLLLCKTHIIFLKIEMQVLRVVKNNFHTFKDLGIFNT